MSLLLFQLIVSQQQQKKQVRPSSSPLVAHAAVRVLHLDPLALPCCCCYGHKSQVGALRGRQLSPGDVVCRVVLGRGRLRVATCAAAHRGCVVGQHPAPDAHLQHLGQALGWWFPFQLTVRLMEVWHVGQWRGLLWACCHCSTQRRLAAARRMRPDRLAAVSS